ncbi:MAG: hypothetical protein J2P25_16175 [Nocardiopsaceae bacterium]|nr:hypothetical protein [Nocardiopsaceae bacterium]
MSFSMAQYDAVISRIQDGMKKAVEEANAQAQSARSEFGWIPGLGDNVNQILAEEMRLLKEAERRVDELLGWAGVPVFMWRMGDTWMSIAKEAMDSASELDRMLEQEKGMWDGRAGRKYKGAVPKQKSAVEQIQTSYANPISSSCTATAVVGFGFYVAVAVAVAALVDGGISAAVTEGAGMAAGLDMFFVALAAAITELEIGVHVEARAFRQAGEVPDAFLSGRGHGRWPGSTN